MKALRLAMCAALGLGAVAMTGGCEDKTPNQPNPQTGGGTVWVAHPDPERWDHHAETEQATARLRG